MFHNAFFSWERYCKKMHPIAQLDGFVGMYGSRAKNASDTYGPRCTKVCVVARMKKGQRVVPDMKVEFMTREELLTVCRTDSASLSAAMSLFDAAARGEVPVGVVVDGDPFLTTVRIAKVE